MTKNRRYWTGAVKAPAQDRFFVESLDPGLWSQGDKDNWDTCWHTGMPAKEVFAHLKHKHTTQGGPRRSLEVTELALPHFWRLTILLGRLKAGAVDITAEATS